MSILEAAVEVLRCFSPTRETLTVTDVVTLRRTPKSSTSRLLRAMRDAGLLETVGETKRFRPSALLFELGQSYRSASTLVARADRAVAELVTQVGHTGYVSVLDGAEVLGLTYHVGRNVLRVGTPIGRRMAASATATGRSLLARLPDEGVRALYAEGVPHVSARSPATVDELLARLGPIRAQGYAVSDGEANPGVGGLAAAVGDPQTGEAVSLCLTYPSGTVTAAEREAMIAGLVAGARSIAGLLGDTLCAAPAHAA